MRCKPIVRKFLLLCVGLLCSLAARAQFAADFGGGNNNAYDMQNDTASYVRRPPFKFKTYFTSLSGKDSLNITRMWMGSLVPGYGQAYNRQYWKIPLFYAGIGAGIYAGQHFHHKYQETEEFKHFNYSTLGYIGAGVFYLGSMLDAVVNYPSAQPVLPARASLMSALCPGLGQIYNGDYWKLPIIYGGLAACGYFYTFNNKQYQRYRVMYQRATTDEDNFSSWMTPENIQWYRNTFRRYRDYSILATVAVYVINIIDANVFAYFQDFDVSDDLSFHFSPALIQPVSNTYYTAASAPAYGLQLQLKF